MMTERDISNKELLDRLLNVVRAECTSVKNEIKSEIKTENNKIIENMTLFSRKLQSLECKYKSLEECYTRLDRQIRKNNILIFGFRLPNKDNDLLANTLDQIKEYLSIEVTEGDINNIYKIKVNQGWAIKFEFISHLKKQSVMKNTFKLKGTKIVFVQDMNYQDRQSRKILQQHYNKAKSKNMYTRIKGNKLQVNDEFYTVEQLQEHNKDACRTEDEEEEEESAKNSGSIPTSPAKNNTYFEDSLKNYHLESPTQISFSNFLQTGTSTAPYERITISQTEDVECASVGKKQGRTEEKQKKTTRT
nr:unnamed protein product [Callosobruchus chinensis]